MAHGDGGGEQKRGRKRVKNNSESAKKRRERNGGLSEFGKKCLSVVTVCECLHPDSSDPSDPSDAMPWLRADYRKLGSAQGLVDADP